MKEKFLTFIKSQAFRSAVACILFLLLAGKLFLGITYLFRNEGTNRKNIVGIKEVSDLDMVYIGGSEPFVYFQVPRVWNDYGYTSYDYATEGFPAEPIKGSIREILKHHNPELFIIDARPFTYWGVHSPEAGTRNVIDSMDVSLNRFLTVADCFRYREIGSEPNHVSFYFDIAKYHSNTEVLAKESAWKLSGNRETTDFNGWTFMPNHTMFSRPTNVPTQEQAPLLEGSEAILRDLMDFCKKKDLNVLFVICPFVVQADEQKQFNYMQELIESNGYHFINGNNYFDEMGIDFARDLYDSNHINTFGAEKFTRFLADYIRDNYSLTDHRGDSRYSSWDTLYQEFLEKEAACKAKIEALWAAEEASFLAGDALRAMDNPYQWLSAVQDRNYCLLVVSDGAEWQRTAQSDRVLAQLQLPTDRVAGQLRVLRGSECLYECAATSDEVYTAPFPVYSLRSQHYTLRLGADSAIEVGETDYAVPQRGIKLVVYDLNYCEVLDSVVLTQEPSGDIALIRK